MSRESMSALIYQLDGNSVVYESESLNQARNLAKCYQVVDFIIFNSTYRYINHAEQVRGIKKLAPNCKIVLIMHSNEPVNIDTLVDKGADSLITINSNKSEVIAAIQSLKHEQPFIGQYVLKSTDDGEESGDSEKLPMMKNGFVA